MFSKIVFLRDVDIGFYLFSLKQTSFHLNYDKKPRKQ